MKQLDLLEHGRLLQDIPLDRAGIVERLSSITTRPRFAFHVLDLIERGSRTTGSVGPFVLDAEQQLPVRDWLCDAIIPVSGREPARLALAARIRRALLEQDAFPADPKQAQSLIDEKVREHLRQAGRSNISRAVSDLVKAGYVRRHYQGYVVDHHNRGAQRQAVYQVTDAARRALRVG